jgi:hypothetical protein
MLVLGRGLSLTTRLTCPRVLVLHALGQPISGGCHAPHVAAEQTGWGHNGWARRDSSKCHLRSTLNILGCPAVPSLYGLPPLEPCSKPPTLSRLDGWVFTFVTKNTRFIGPNGNPSHERMSRGMGANSPRANSEPGRGHGRHDLSLNKLSGFAPAVADADSLCSQMSKKFGCGLIVRCSFVPATKAMAGHTQNSALNN